MAAAAAVRPRDGNVFQNLALDSCLLKGSTTVVASYARSDSSKTLWREFVFAETPGHKSVVTGWIIEEADREANRRSSSEQTIDDDSPPRGSTTALWAIALLRSSRKRRRSANESDDREVCAMRSIRSRSFTIFSCRLGPPICIFFFSR